MGGLYRGDDGPADARRQTIMGSIGQRASNLIDILWAMDQIVYFLILESILILAILLLVTLERGDEGKA